MKTKNQTTFFQALNLSTGERAACRAAYPRTSLVVVECIKNFDTAKDPMHILNNWDEYVKIVHYGLIGVSTSHLISTNWYKQ